MTHTTPLSLAVAALAFGAYASAETCGSAPYSPGQYYCYNNEYLCPIVNGEVYLHCGDGACYSESKYECVNGQLSPHSAVADAMTQYCGNQPYSAADYYCFDADTDPFLCPVAAGKTYVRCGQSCYLPTEYSCSNGQLNSTPAVSPLSYCRHTYDDCEVYVTDPATGQKYLTIVACCQEDETSTFACVATKCRNLTQLGEQLSHGGRMKRGFAKLNGKGNS